MIRSATSRKRLLLIGGAATILAGCMQNRSGQNIAISAAEAPGRARQAAANVTAAASENRSHLPMPE